MDTACRTNPRASVTSITWVIDGSCYHSPDFTYLREDKMAAESKLESRNDRDSLTETELDGVVAGADNYANTMQLISNVLRMLADTQKAVIANIR